MCPPCYHHNGFMATHALGHMMYGCHKAIVVVTGGTMFHDYIYYGHLASVKFEHSVYRGLLMALHIKIYNLCVYLPITFR